MAKFVQNYDMKKCIKCKLVKDLSEFNKNRGKPDGHQNVCRKCQNAYSKEHYDKDPEYYKTKRLKRSVIIKQYLYDYLKDNGCIDCGESNPACLDFDHRDDIDKGFNLANAPQRGFSIKQLEVEMRKCDIRCANCHRKRTADQYDWYSSIVM